MKMKIEIPDAKESLRRSIINRNSKIDSQYETIKHEINNTAYNGETECTIFLDLYPENISILKEKGYKISTNEDKTIISWKEEPEEIKINIKEVFQKMDSINKKI